MRKYSAQLKGVPSPDPLLKTSPVCKYVFSATGNQEAFWLQNSKD